MLIDHIVISATDLPGATEFFLRALAPLSLELIDQGVRSASLGVGGKLVLCLQHEPLRPMDTMKISFAASSREKVRECYAAAISAGGQDIHAAPRVQPQLNRICYSAMVMGPDRHNIEVTTYDSNP